MIIWNNGEEVVSTYYKEQQKDEPPPRKTQTQSLCALIGEGPPPCSSFSQSPLAAVPHVLVLSLLAPASMAAAHTQWTR
jgi:hypothetical protein